MPDSSSTYIGRFAPSPTGELHQGSLLTAVASYLDARQQQGLWLVRMEDLDPPREQKGAADSILRSLQAHGLLWDGEVMLQSQRHDAYAAHLQQLFERDACFICDCTRQRLKSLPAYDGHCRRHPPTSKPVATRVAVPDGTLVEFDDLFQNRQSQQLDTEVGDFVIHRKDGLYAYQLAVVVDDIEQNISHIIRGVDLLDSTARQVFLFQQFNAKPPVFGHLPVVVNADGQKLSKQTFAEPLNNDRAADNLWRAFNQLNLAPPAGLREESCEQMLSWGVEHWDRSKIAATQSIPESTA